jgi:hypothetical protein
LKDQENYIDIEGQEAKTSPKLGENVVSVSQPDGIFLESHRQFFTLAGQKTVIEIPLVTKLKDGELAVVLSWQQGSSQNGDEIEK